ncbi:hypothetical protein AB6A23_03545 [Paenibacillus tarimensis]
MRQNVMWQPVVNALQQSLFAEQMVCSMSTQLFHIPETKDLRGNEEMHNHLVPASYHRVTALGSARRLADGESAPSIVATMMSCIEQAEQQDREVRRGLGVMHNAAPARYKPFIATIISWQHHAEMYLQTAKRQAQQLVGPAAMPGQYQY